MFFWHVVPALGLSAGFRDWLASLGQLGLKDGSGRNTGAALDAAQLDAFYLVVNQQVPSSAAWALRQFFHLKLSRDPCQIGR